MPEQEELRRAVDAVLSEIDRLNREQVEVLKAWDDSRLLAVDKELENTFGEKERTFGKSMVVSWGTS